MVALQVAVTISYKVPNVNANKLFIIMGKS
jgi:hypothetical protein